MWFYRATDCVSETLLKLCFKIYFLFVCRCDNVGGDVYEAQKGALEPLELEIQVVVSLPNLGTAD